MQAAHLAYLVEFSEARAYRSLMQAAPEPLLEAHDMHSLSIGSAVAVVSGTVTNSLNMNRVIGLGVAEAASEEVLDEIFALYQRHGVSFGIELCPVAAPAALKAWLQQRRMRRGVATAMHYREAQPISPVDRSSSSLTVRRAKPSESDLVAEICCSVFRMPEPARAALAGTAVLSDWRQWIGYADGRPVAAALSFIRDGIAWLGWDATVPEFRGRGAQSALIAHRINDACSSGCEYITTETAPGIGERADASFRNYARNGFSFAYERFTYISMRKPNR